MTAIAQQVADFVAASAPFDTLDVDALTDLLTSAELLYVTKENLKTLMGQSRRIYLIQSGQFSVSAGQEPPVMLAKETILVFSVFWTVATMPWR
nr:hypothetical protein [Alteromonas stellipolaris]